MKYNNLGKSGLKISELCFGTMTFGGIDRFGEIGSIALSEAKKLVDIAIRIKETFIDRVVEYFFGYYRSPIKQLLRVSNLKKIRYSIRDYKSRKINNQKTNKM